MSPFSPGASTSAGLASLRRTVRERLEHYPRLSRHLLWAWRDLRWSYRRWRRFLASRRDGGLEVVQSRQLIHVPPRSIQPSSAVDFGNTQTPDGFDGVSVAIGRHGELVLTDGSERLLRAIAARTESIPALVTARHPAWVRFQKQVEMHVKESGGTAYQPPQHPDLGWVPAARECEDRFRLILESMASRQGNLLDIGANWGFFCHKFEEIGFDCVAVEEQPEEVFFLRKLRDAQHRRFRIVAESVLSADVVREREFAVVLALNIFHHFLKTRSNFARLGKLLAELKANEVFFEPHHESDEQMRSAEVYMLPEQFAAFVADRLGMRNVQLLGRATEGRALFRLSDRR